MAPKRLMTTDGSGDWVTPYPASPSIHLIVKTRMFRSTLIATGVGDNPDWVERLKEGWETKVIELLDSISNGTWTQKIVMAAIKRRCGEKGYEVVFYPREYHPKNTPSKGLNELEVIDQYLNSAADGNTRGGTSAPPEGETAFVYFDPDPWRADSFMRQEAAIMNPAKFGGVGMEPRDVLFHELVHALRRLKGVTDRTPTTTRDYVNLEEFTAVLVTNIAISENNQFAPLRYGERTFIAMPERYKTSAGFLQNAENADLVKRIIARDFTLPREIANSPTPNPFNPFRRSLRGALWAAPRADW
jgi:Effector protein